MNRALAGELQVSFPNQDGRKALHNNHSFAPLWDLGAPTRRTFVCACPLPLHSPLRALVFINNCDRGAQQLVHRAGVIVSKFSLDEMQYTPEIAAVMLKAQQARATIQVRGRSEGIYIFSSLYEQMHRRDVEFLASMTGFRLAQ